MKRILLTLLIPMMAFAVMAKTETIVIKSSLVCGMCEDAIRDGLAFEKGIKRVSTDVDANEITIKFNPKKISAEDIKHKIAHLGYDADDVKADEHAYEELPACCKKGGSCDGDKHDHHEEEGEGHDHEDDHNHDHKGHKGHEHGHEHKK
ncbi:MAG: heavy-metal-associated domain-containing protein [Bacteroidetes bacterium]|nr:heavy-metal-associated domain-containing protein [Bacteroidota bacterium]